MKTLQISDQKAKELYAKGSNEFKTILEESFGKAFFSSDITERIKTYEDACHELGIVPIDEEEMIELGFEKDNIALIKLKTIVKALNEGETPNIFDSNVYRWYPYFRVNGSSSSFAFCASCYGDTCAIAGSGSHLALKSEKLSNYIGKQFLNLWKEIIL